MTININGFDYDKLNEMIDLNEIPKNKYGRGISPILIMSSDTAEQMSKDLGDVIGFPFFAESKGKSVGQYKLGQCVIAEYRGHKVYVDDDYKFGQVEIR